MTLQPRREAYDVLSEMHRLLFNFPSSREGRLGYPFCVLMFSLPPRQKSEEGGGGGSFSRCCEPEFLASRSLSVQRALGCSRVQLEVALGPGWRGWGEASCF